VLVARLLGGFGRLLIWVGAIVLLFVAYQLWGTNIAEARAQDDLESEFEDRLATTTTTTSTTRPRSRTTTTTTTAPDPAPPPDDGSAVARMVIPRIGVDKIVVEGVGRRDLEKGPGHYPGTPLPGQPGNAAIAGHRTTYGAPFNRIDELVAGDEILVTTLQGSFTYEVIGHEIVAPSAVEVVDDQGDDRLTITSCHPKYSARERIVLTAELADEPAPAPPPVEAPERPEDELPDEEPDRAAAPELEVLDGDERGPLAPAFAWGAVVLVVWLAFYALSRRWRPIPAYLLGAPVFAIALFVFFEAVAETLPANF
jgi:sortase A